MSFFVEVPNAPPRPFGLTSVATVIDNSSANWRGDTVAFETLGCGLPPMPILSACPEDYLVMNSTGELEYTRAKQVTTGAGFARGEVVTLYSINECFLDGTVGNAGQQANWQAQALARFNRGESAGLESALAQLFGKESGETDLTVYEPLDAYLRLVQLMGDYTGVPVYHLDLLAPHLLDREIRRKGNRLEDEYGGLVSVGQGYHRAGIVGPDGEGVNPDDTVRWMYGSGAVYIWRAPALIHTVPSPETNRSLVLIERTYAIGTDCGPVAVRYGYVPAESDATATPLPIPARYVEPKPTITSLEPATHEMDGGADFKAHVRGTGFTRDTVIVWGGGRTEPTTFVSDTDVWTLVSPSSIPAGHAPFTDVVTVRNGNGENVDPGLPFTWTEIVKARTKVHPSDRIEDESTPGDTDMLDDADEGDPAAAWAEGEAATFGTNEDPWDATWDGSHWVAVEPEPEPEPEPDPIPVTPSEQVIDDDIANGDVSGLDQKYVGSPKDWAQDDYAVIGPENAPTGENEFFWTGDNWEVGRKPKPS